MPSLQRNEWNEGWNVRSSLWNEWNPLADSAEADDMQRVSIVLFAVIPTQNVIVSLDKQLS